MTRTVRLDVIILLAVFFVIGDVATSALVTGSWPATFARASGLAAYVFILNLMSEPWKAK